MADESTTEVVSYDLMEDHGIFVLSGEINSCVSTAIIKWVLESNLSKDKKFKELTLIINSPGGELTDCFAIIDIMNSSKIPIKTVGLGQICSCGFLIFINGKNRILTPNTCVMCHPYSWGSGGQHHELVSIRKEQDLMQARTLAHVVKCTKLTKKKTATILLKETDTYLNSDECLEYGICDEVKNL